MAWARDYLPTGIKLTGKVIKYELVRTELFCYILKSIIITIRIVVQGINARLVPIKNNCPNNVWIIYFTNYLTTFCILLTTQMLKDSGCEAHLQFFLRIPNTNREKNSKRLDTLCDLCLSVIKPHV